MRKKSTCQKATSMRRRCDVPRALILFSKKKLILGISNRKENAKLNINFLSLIREIISIW